MENKLEYKSIIFDPRSKCYSVFVEINISEYLNIIELAYNKSGGIKGQRTTLKTKSAISIRERLVEDLSNGTVIPPIVLGYLTESKPLIADMSEENLAFIINEAIENSTNSDIDNESIQNNNDNNILEKNKIVIIDGMQRTTALYEAVKLNPNIAQNPIRVEFWLSNYSNSLIYRMLILNTGQVPWNLRQQIEVVYTPLINEISKEVPGIKLIKFDDNERRTEAKQFQAKDIIDLYITFGSRNVDFNTSETLSDQFTKLDFIESTSDPEFNKAFYEILNVMCEVDSLIFNSENLADEGKFKDGKDLFKSATSKIGFIAAAAIEIYGYPGEELSEDEISNNKEFVLERLNSFSNTIKEKIETNTLKEFLAFDTLNEKIAGKTSGIGNFERNGFKDAFRFLISSNRNFANLSVIWRSIKR